MIDPLEFVERARKAQEAINALGAGPPGTKPQHVEIKLVCEDGHVMGTYRDSMNEKYPLWCEDCGDTMSGKYPFTIITEIKHD